MRAAALRQELRRKGHSARARILPESAALRPHETPAKTKMSTPRRRSVEPPPMDLGVLAFRGAGRRAIPAGPAFRRHREARHRRDHAGRTAQPAGPRRSPCSTSRARRPRNSSRSCRANSSAPSGNGCASTCCAPRSHRGSVAACACSASVGRRAAGRRSSLGRSRMLLVPAIAGDFARDAGRAPLGTRRRRARACRRCTRPPAKLSSRRCSISTC